MTALIGLVPGEARAYTCLRFGCPTWCGTVSYGLASPSADLEALGAGTSEEQLQLAMGDWGRVPCTSLTTSFTGTGAPTPGPVDGQTVFGWFDSDWPFDSNAIGISTVELSLACIVESDVSLNGVNYQWTTGPGEGARVNAYGVLAHEAGHVFGLGHVADGLTPSVMFFLNTGARQLLSEDDFAGICALYPGGADDCTTNGCPFGYVCDAGMCLASNPPECTRPEDCAAGQRCDAVSGACVPDSPGTEVLGAPCIIDADCESGLCAPLADGGVCSEACDGLAPRGVACPSGFYCDGDAVGVCGTGLCLRGSPGDGSLGSPCEEDSDCASNMCDGLLCATPCDPDATEVCPLGFVCEPGDATGCGACKPPLPLGAVCRFNEDCREGICFVDSSGGTNDGLCTLSCESEDCPADMRCAERGGVAVCEFPPSMRGGSSCAVSPRRGVAEPLVGTVWLLLGLLVLARRARRA